MDADYGGFVGLGITLEEGDVAHDAHARLCALVVSSVGFGGGPILGRVVNLVIQIKVLVRGEDTRHARDNQLSVTD